MNCPTIAMSISPIAAAGSSNISVSTLTSAATALAVDAANAAVTESAAQIRSQISQLQQEEESHPTAQLQQEIQQLQEAQKQQENRVSGPEALAPSDATPSSASGVHLNIQA